MCGTRYGNVMASRGSVIPLFVEQIKSGKPLTITNPNMTRFMMSLDNAIDLVLFAFQCGNPGDIFVQKAPACTIDVLVRALLRLFGSKNEVRTIGTRHGEKIYESLMTSEEMADAEDLGSYFRIKADNRDLNYNKYFNEGELLSENISAYTSHNTKRLDVDETAELLLSLKYIREQLA
jgi:UDP-N-acetylglucosamine 4,6-dehydratase/5-epimerase